MKFAVGAVSMLFLVLGAVAVGFQDPQPLDQDSRKFMRKKLDSSRSIVEGLAIEDYTKIAQNAQNMMLLSHESEWNVIQTDSYVKMSGDFRSSAERLRDAAKAKNLDGATLAYFEVTLNCVRCHKYVRKTK